MKKYEEKRAIEAYNKLNISSLPGEAWELATYILGIVLSGHAITLDKLPAILKGYRRDLSDARAEAGTILVNTTDKKLS
jgi:hypothetical protein